MLLKTVWSIMNERLSKHGQVVIAGGAVRDSLMGRKVKDYDVFLLGQQKALAEEIRLSVGDLVTESNVPEPRSDDPFVQHRFVHVRDNERLVIEVIWNGAPDIDALLDKFDWNCSRFAWDGARHHVLTPISELAKGKPLKLHRVTFPLSTLRRGYRFSERLGLVFSLDDQIDLCRQVYFKSIENEEEAEAA